MINDTGFSVVVNHSLHWHRPLHIVVPLASNQALCCVSLVNGGKS